MSSERPQIDLICNVVIRGEDGRILLTRYDDDDARWWLPGRDLVPYEHPDEVAPKVLAELGELEVKNLEFIEIESFRGRSGWHVMFNYLADVAGEARGDNPTEWFAPNELPQTAHGGWEKQVVRRSLERAARV